MKERGRLIAGIVLLAALIIGLSLIGREKNEIIQEERIQAAEEERPRSRKTSTETLTSPAGERGAPEAVASAESPAVGESDRGERGDGSSPSAEEFDPGSTGVSEAPMTAAEFNAIAPEGEAGASNRYDGQKIGLNEGKLKLKAYREKLTAYREARREWKVRIEEAERQARATGDFRELNEIREQRPLPPRMESGAPVRETTDRDPSSAYENN